MVQLTRIYTRTGDAGQTRLADMSAVAKADLRVAAYGDVDEANSAIGAALATGQLSAEVFGVLRLIQNEMFDLGADLSTPLLSNPEHEPLRITQDYVNRLEGWCDSFGEPLPPLDSFILPGGLLGAAELHLARTITRRAERSTWLAIAQYGTDPSDEKGVGGVNPLATTYLNRLSDLLFILTRVVNGVEGEATWVPGGERHHDAVHGDHPPSFDTAPREDPDGVDPT